MIADKRVFKNKLSLHGKKPDVKTFAFSPGFHLSVALEIPSFVGALANRAILKYGSKELSGLLH
jgi:hypothetical protein